MKDKYNVTARLIGDKIEISYYDIKEPDFDGWPYDQWLKSKRTVELNPEFVSELKELINQMIQSDGYLFGIAGKTLNQILIEGISIEAINHRIEIVEDKIPLAKNAPYFLAGKECEWHNPTIIDGKPYAISLRAVLLPEVKEESRRVFTESDMKSFAMAVGVFLFNRADNKSILEITNSTFEKNYKSNQK
jgi:hypothetical protein